MITSAWKNLLRDALKGTVTDIKIKYMAWGSGTTAPATTDTALGNELGRKLITTQIDGATGIIDHIQYLSKNDANVHIYEIGFFGGAGATMTAGSGTLATRFLYDRDKNNLQSIQINLNDKIQEG